MSTGEVIHESETGGQKAGNDDRYDLLPPREMRTIAALYGTRYAEHWSNEGGSFNELQNQLTLFWDGDDVDPETGFLRPALVALQALELLEDRLSHKTWQLDVRADSIYRFDHIPAEPLRLLAHHYGVGARKYAADNWQKGHDWRLTFAALNRHLWQHQSGQFLDEETGSPHLVAVVWHAITLLWFYENKPEFDTRTSTKQRIAEEEADWAWFEALPTEELADGLSFNDPFVEESWVDGFLTWVDGFLTLAKELAADTAVPPQLLDELMKPIYQDTTLAALEFEREHNLPQAESPQVTITYDADGRMRAWSLPDYQYLGAVHREPAADAGPVYYISGPMTGMPEHNFPAFHAAAEYYRAQGITVINPAELPGEGDEHPREWFLRRDLVAMLEGGADTIVMLPGWGSSKGARLEYHVAKALGFGVHDHDPHLTHIVADLDDTEGAA